MFILGIKNPDGTIGDIKVFDTLPDLRGSVEQSVSDEVGKGHFVIFEEWSIARLFEAAAQNFEVSSAG